MMGNSNQVFVGAAVADEMKRQVMSLAEKHQTNQSEIVRKAIRFYYQSQQPKIVTAEESMLTNIINKFRYGKRKKPSG